MPQARRLTYWRFDMGWRDSYPVNLTPRHSFIVLGTGRCGTLSLKMILDGCNNTAVLHEGYLCGWDEIESSNIEHMIRAMEFWGNQNVLAGNVSFGLLPHLNKIMTRLPQIKIVCMHREKEEVVKSFLKRFGEEPLKKHEDGTFRAFPNIGSWEDYVDMYEAEMAKMDGAFHIWTEELNDDARLNELYDFLEIPEEDKMFPEERKWNASL